MVPAFVPAAIVSEHEKLWRFTTCYREGCRPKSAMAAPARNFMIAVTFVGQ
jgi:hypothetical protein